LAAAYAAEISKRLAAGLGSRSKSEVAASAELARSTLHDLLTGRTWPDVVSLVQLESVLGVKLWPDGPLIRGDRSS
jgi:hypothetical protein